MSTFSVDLYFIFQYVSRATWKEKKLIERIGSSKIQKLDFCQETKTLFRNNSGVKKKKEGAQ